MFFLIVCKLNNNVSTKNKSYIFADNVIGKIGNGSFLRCLVEPLRKEISGLSFVTKSNPLFGVVHVPRKSSLFCQSEVCRAVKGAQQAGMQVERVIIERSSGNIIVLAKSSDEQNSDNPNEWDNVK